MEQKVKYAINLISENGQVVVSSREVAENFGKEHRNVIQSIENISAENSAVTQMFFKTTYTAGTGKSYPMYLMNRDGFTLLAMGFTGKEALEWKLKYIDAFNQMEQKLTNPEPESTEMLLSRALIAANSVIDTERKKVKALEAENAKMKPDSDYAKAMLLSDESLTTTQIAMNYGLTARKLNKILKEMGIQHVVNKQWIPYKKYLGNGYVVGHPIELPNGKTKEVARWTRAGQKFIYSKLKEAGYLPVGEQIRMETC
jgi:Rha family phage regulatory protein|nr:MAG TPA: regulatory protein [Caudoviricetes sp.]